MKAEIYILAWTWSGMRLWIDWDLMRVLYCAGGLAMLIDKAMDF